MSANPPVANPWMILPFCILMALIALGPLGFPKWWHRHYPKATYALALITMVYYFFGLHAGQRIGHVAHEYISFIALIGSLFVVAGGIHINVKGEATPFVNMVFLLIGAILANLLGTTGASMLLIRPWLRMNKYRVTAHHVVFFIFIVSNIGGCLTPIGDPPLFLGYLAGVPFWWVAKHCFPMWLVGMAVLLAMFFVVDYRNYLRAPKAVRSELTEHDQWRFEGLGNVGFLGVILAAVFINQPPYLREALMVGAAIGSYFTTRADVHAANHFDFHPIKEVAVLFIGIFATMLPALDWLEANAKGADHINISWVFWGCGSLSSALDNAPTYLCFLKALTVHFASPDIVGGVNHLIQTGGVDITQVSGPHAEQIRQTFLILQKYYAVELASGKIGSDQIAIASLLGNAEGNQSLAAIAMGAVFFGANTYIGNGPNFMVKSIAEHQKVRTPGFLGYLWHFTLPFMLPMLLIVWWLFFRHQTL
ncbi:MAG TPA: sodium:proton antiporter [Verrucomicrobiae bacterium]|nr:sodium:proton antiporter [Verrucomicrobiae bacterium]